MNRGVVKIPIIRENLAEDDGTSARYEVPLEISSTLLDTYFTSMDDTSLRNFMNEAAEGRAVLEGHVTSRLPLGYSFSGMMEALSDRQRVVSKIFLVRGIGLNTSTYVSTDNLITMLVNNAVRDVSIGFFGGIWRCSICKQDVFDYSNYDEYCRHWPGREYEIDGKKIIATASIEDAHLSEISFVYDGATPEAKVLRKVQSLYRVGMIDERVVDGLSNFYGVRMPFDEWQKDEHERRFSMPVLDLLKEAEIEGLPTDNEETGVSFLIERAKTLDTRIGELSTEIDEIKAGSDPNPDVVESLRQMREQCEDLREQVKVLQELREADKTLLATVDEHKERASTLATQVTDLTYQLTEATEMADLGKTVREELVKSIHEEGVRAFGDVYDEESQNLLLENAEIPALRTTLDKYREKSTKRFDGNRKTGPTEPNAMDPPLGVNNVSDRSFGISQARE